MSIRTHPAKREYSHLRRESRPYEPRSTISRPMALLRSPTHFSNPDYFHNYMVFLVFYILCNPTKCLDTGPSNKPKRISLQIRTRLVPITTAKATSFGIPRFDGSWPVGGPPSVSRRRTAERIVRTSVRSTGSRPLSPAASRTYRPEPRAAPEWDGFRGAMNSAKFRT